MHSEEEQTDYVLDCVQNVMYDYLPVAGFWEKLNLDHFKLQNYSTEQVVSIVPFINLKDETYSESIGNSSSLQAEDWVKQIMMSKDVKSDEKQRFSILMFYYLNAPSVSLTPNEFHKLMHRVIGSLGTRMVGLFALERFVRINPSLVDFTNVNDFVNILIESTKSHYLQPISLRLIAVSLENYKAFNNLEHKKLFKSLLCLTKPLSPLQTLFRSQSIATLLEIRPDLVTV